MRMLSVSIEVSQDKGEWPQHLGGVLHGFVESAVLNHAPQQLERLRPWGDQGPASFAVHAPPIGIQPDPVLRFGLVLFGQLADAAEEICHALARQCQQRIQGRLARLIDLGVVDADYLETEALPTRVRLHQLTMRSPVLLASRSAARDGLKVHGQLPWPTLGSVLNSIAQRLSTLEPELATFIHLPTMWRASAQQHETSALTPAHEPAQQVSWVYSATPRSGPATPHTSARRQLPVPGILGTLLYPASDDPLEMALLHWGQWLGVGQKTTMGCGSYVWQPLV